MLDLQHPERHFSALGGIAGVVLHIRARFEIQWFGLPGRVDSGSPVVSCCADAQRALRTEMDLVRKIAVERHTRRNGNDLALFIVGAHAHLDDNVSRRSRRFVLVFQFHHRVVAVLVVNLTNHDLAGAGHLIDAQTRPQNVICR